ncbi:hypothetical protein MACH08_03920 [Oceanobacillus kimchii]|uniref:Uncharacterized protein n=1 Tax=Oceanobacillus kimchii TaxID=746691 RepID=A0ABQ5TD71_9BACI|nr:hypothetical protein MACH08_03920 [Oceanobacillus kimchii]
MCDENDKCKLSYFSYALAYLYAGRPLTCNCLYMFILVFCLIRLASAYPNFFMSTKH